MRFFGGLRWLTGGGRRSSTRSTSAAFRTRTATASAICHGITQRLDYLNDGTPRLARRRRAVADADQSVADVRLRLRRQRLLRRRPAVRHARRRRPADRRSASARHARHPRPRPEPHVARARLVPRVARVAHVAAARLVHLARPGARRRAAEQLGEQLRRAGVDARSRRPGSTTCTRSSPSSPISTTATPPCARRWRT